NLLVRGGRDARVWVAFAFGLIHGFGFANVLREMDLPRRALGWSLFSFNAGVEIGQVSVVATVAAALTAIRARSEQAFRRLAVAGSVAVILAGGFWFVQRVFFPYSGKAPGGPGIGALPLSASMIATSACGPFLCRDGPAAAAGARTDNSHQYTRQTKPAHE